MLGLYLFAMIVGVGLLLFTIVLGGDHDAPEADLDFDAEAEVELESGHGEGLGSGVGDLVLGLFRPRNLTFLLASFGTTGTLLTLARTGEALTLPLAIGMGVAAWLASHGVFTWLRRTDSGIDALDDRDLEGTIGIVTLPITPGGRGRITVEAAGRQAYLTARLSGEVERALPVGTEVLIRRTEGGVAEVMPTDSLGLPPVSPS